MFSKVNSQSNKTGYPSIDKPWNQFYEGVERKDLFLNTTPYIGLIKNNKNHLTETAIEYFGAKISYGKLFENINRVAKSLEKLGVKNGDFVTICSTTTPEVIYTFYALSKIGAAANIISPFFPEKDFLMRIDECKSKVIIFADRFFPKYREIFSEHPDKKVVILPLMNSTFLRFFSKRIKINKSNEISWNTFIKIGNNQKETSVCPYEFHKPLAMVYSSGTTGASKGIVLSVDSFQKLINAYGNSGFEITRGQSIYQNVPPWHLTGLSLSINFPLSYGVKICIDPRFDQYLFVKNVLKFKPEYILTSAIMYQGFTLEKSLKKLNGKSLSFLKYPFSGGEVLTAKDVEQIESVLKTHGCKARMLSGYGQCESGTTVTTDITNYKFSNSASGIPLRDIAIIVVFDENHKELKYKERGNIMVKSEVCMLEYLNNPKATEDYFYTDENGEKWCKTGDIGYINPDGSLVVQGRKSDCSVINGKTVYNFDIEAAVQTSPHVKICEVQTHPENPNELVAHIVWENEVAEIINNNPEKEIEYLKDLQNSLKNVLEHPESIPHLFCSWAAFPIATSGKRDIKLIKRSIENLRDLK